MLAVLAVVAGAMRGTGKYSVARGAKLIVVGKFLHGWTVPWFDGWHVTGMIDVEEALY
jgi:hypothetical protein